MSELDTKMTELRTVAEQLQTGQVQGEEAAALVQRCADLAAEIGAALEEKARAARSEPDDAPDQGSLL